jgi:ureidoglycolate hydrolase
MERVLHMSPLRVKALSPEAFRPYGSYGSLTPPDTAPLSPGEVIAFYPDCGGVLTLGPAGSNQVAIGICQVKWRPLLIDVCEFHTSTGEGILPIDGDIYLHLGPPTGGDEVPVDKLEVFFVPQGTMVTLKPGVWHHAPFATREGQTVHTQILLPQRTYANDCVVRQLEVPVPFAP